MTDLAAKQLRELFEKKECAIYALVGVAQIASAYLNLDEVQKAQNLLQGAVLDYELADQAIAEFRNQQSKPAQSENPAQDNPAHSAA